MFKDRNTPPDLTWLVPVAIVGILLIVFGSTGLVFW